MKYLAKITHLTKEDYTKFNIDPKCIKRDKINLWYECNNLDEVDKLEDADTDRYYEAEAKKNFSTLISILEGINALTQFDDENPSLTWSIEKSRLYIKGRNGMLGNIFSMFCYTCRNFAFYFANIDSESMLEVLYTK